LWARASAVSSECRKYDFMEDNKVVPKRERGQTYYGVSVWSIV